MCAQISYAENAATSNPIVLSVLRWMAEQQKEAGRRFARLRLERGFTQESLASAAKVAHRTIQAWEEGAVSNPRPSSIRKVALTLKVEEGELRTILNTYNSNGAADIFERLERLERAVFDPTIAGED